MEKKIIITIERQCGSGGEKIGRALAERLGIACFDREILIEASRETNIEEKIFENCDEVFVNAGIYSMVQDVRAAKAGMGEYRQPPAERVYLAEFNVIRKLAEKQSGIFIGRCSDFALHEYTNAIHFFVHAPIDVRVERVCQHENLERRDAEIIVRKRDKEREKYYNYYTNRKWGDMYNYNLSINTGKIGLDEAVSILEQYVRSIIGAV